MINLSPLEAIDYLVIGHITMDITPQGSILGGTAVYSALTAHALGLRVGIVTAWGAELPLGPLRHIPIISYPADSSTVFENREQGQTRNQLIHHVAPSLDYYLIPDPWRQAAIVHLAPVAQEVEPNLVRYFPTSLIGLTPQGWLRTWDENKRVQLSEWPESTFILQSAGAAVISKEDVNADETRIEEMAISSRILAVTEGAEGTRLYWNGDVRRFRTPTISEVVDTTGAGDIFAAAFFIRLYSTRDPWEAARFATQLATISVTRSGLDSIPTYDEIQESMVEVL
jgi:hypothetical protein